MSKCLGTRVKVDYGLQHHDPKETLEGINKAVNLACHIGRTLGSCLEGICDCSRKPNSSQHCESDFGTSHKVFEKS